MANTINGQFVWHEYLAKDVQAAIAFYNEAFGWKTEPFNDWYTKWVSSQGPLGGVLPQNLDFPSHWIGNIQVSSVDSTLERAQQLGAKLVHGPVDLPEIGRYAALIDPQGAAFALFEPTAPWSAHDPAGEGEIVWNELLTADADAAWKFYSALFDWKAQVELTDTGEGSYRLFGLAEQNDQHHGGILKSAAHTQATWTFYTSTDDLEAAVARATNKGASLHHGPLDVPGGGRVAILQDPQAAFFAFHSRPKV